MNNRATTFIVNLCGFIFCLFITFTLSCESKRYSNDYHTDICSLTSDWKDHPDWLEFRHSRAALVEVMYCFEGRIQKIEKDSLDRLYVDVLHEHSLDEPPVEGKLQTRCYINPRLQKDDLKNFYPGEIVRVKGAVNRQEKTSKHYKRIIFTDCYIGYWP
jgi:hypothetical protein